MSTMKLSILGLSKWLENEGGDLFENLTLPAGIDKDVVINKIILDSADLEALYSDPYFMQEAIGTWSSMWQRTFQKWYDALQIEYNPLDNFDRHEEYTDDGMTSSTNTGSGNVSNKTHTTETPTGSIVNDHYVTPYDNDTKTLQSEDIESYQSYKSDVDTTASSGTSTTNTGTGSSSSKHVGHLYGNIGVTTSQQMLQSELDIASWNLVQHIVDLFIREFCLLVY